MRLFLYSFLLHNTTQGTRTHTKGSGTEEGTPLSLKETEEQTHTHAGTNTNNKP